MLAIISQNLRGKTRAQIHNEPSVRIVITSLTESVFFDCGAAATERDDVSELEEIAKASLSGFVRSKIHLHSEHIQF
jgi:hypothetical protein